MLHFFIFLVVLLLSTVNGDYDCVCNYNVELPVLPSADDTAPPMGFMYEFDCKPKSGLQAPSNYYTLQFEKKLGFVKIDPQIRLQTCPGSLPDDDLIPTTTRAQTIKTITEEIQITPQPSTTTASEQTTPITSPQITTTTSTTTTPQITTTTTPQPITTTITTPQSTTTVTTTTHQPTTTTTTTTTPQITILTTTTPQPITTIDSTTTPSTTATTATLKPTTTSKQLTTRASAIYSWSSAANVSGTPFQYVGVGYNLLTENPETAFHTTHRVLQLTGTPNNVHEATYVNHTSCQSQKSTTLLHGSKAYQNELKTLVRPSSSHNVQLSQAAFTYNNQFRSDQQVLDGSTNLYIDVITTCNLGTVRYITENASQGNFVVTEEFATDVCALPKELTSSSAATYMQFLDKWGTSIVTSVDLGTKHLERYTTTAQEVFQHVQQTDTALLEHQDQFEGFSSSVIINTQKFGNSHASATPFGTLKELFMGTFQHQIPIGSDIVPIVDVLDKVYWKTILDQLVVQGICGDSIYVNDLDQYKTNFQNALIQYPGYKNSQQPHPGIVDRPTLQLPVTWPSGTYGLMKAASGCPMNNAHWAEGWRKQDTEDINNKNDHSPDLYSYMAAEFHGSDVTTRFCMKTSTHSISGSQYDQQWPSGAYCILKSGLCPIGFGEGFVKWDDEDNVFGSTHNDKGGFLPDGTYDSNTEIHYCCRNDGSPANEIFLPTDHPFILIRYGGSCQSVHGMSVHGLFIKWDDEDFGNKDSKGGMHPADDGGSGNHLLYFCFYQMLGGPSFVG